MIPDDVFHEISSTPPDPQRDDPTVSSFWRRRAALMLGLHDRNAPWVDVIGAVEHREYHRDRRFAGDLALRHLRVEADELRALVARLVEPYDDPCLLDHHGYCQAHNLHSPPCPAQVAKELLAAAEAPDAQSVVA